MLSASVVGPQPSWDLVADYQILTHYPYMQHAFEAGTLVAILAGVVGYFMVLRGQSFAGHSLANVGFAGATGAALIGLSPVIGLFIAGTLAAAGIQVLGLGARQTRHNDIAVGAIFTASLALGYLFLFITPSEYGASVYTVLFGNPLGVSAADVRTILLATVVFGGVMILIARPLLFASLDPDVAASRGVPVQALSMGYLLVLALVVAVAVEIIGVLLIFALLVTPAAVANILTPRPAVAVGLAVGLGVIFTWLGLAVGFFTPYPVGFFITTFAFGAYVAVQGGRWLWRIFQRRAAAPTLIGGAA
jgi:zinc/manganese transport system permease protein